MWKNIKNLVSAASDLVAIGSKEVAYQVSKASNATETVTSKLANKASAMRKAYEDNLYCRKEGVDGILVVRRHEDITDVE
ncbi:MAG: hypothetical protein HXX11_15170 [Desulfuromonadales bacterium]|nr:hypothetical protein [Desulfuromonadales bacterium]